MDTIYRISAVSYLNTMPFLYGLRNHKVMNQIELVLDHPARCAEKLLSNEADIGLVPVAVLPEMNNPEIISDYCLGARGPVHSVILYSDVKLHEIESIKLDYQSRTSVNLARILAARYWKIKPNWTPAAFGFENNSLNSKEACLIIGDRSFGMRKKHPYVWDLSEEWWNFTGLPFVFATWTANKQIDKEFLKSFNEALRYGVSHIREAVDKAPENTALGRIELFHYLSEDMSYPLDNEKKEGLNRFIKELKNLNIT
ncbi:MAG: menaquinone biosynthesis protein [Bacteroidota bacterium]|nr:menaquinone biosynthesis protein [Bacteroidota bacterium]